MSSLKIKIAFENKIVYFIRQQRFSSFIAAEENKYDKIAAEIIETTDENVRVNCNKSGLLQQHRNILYEKRPYKEPSSWIHQTEKYQRKVFARYGSESGIDPRICFQKISELESQVLYQKMVEPQAIQNMITKSHLENKQKAEELRKREDYVIKNMEKLDQWKQELQNRVLKKEGDAQAAKQRKERLVEEVRRHFGYKVDPRDEKFKEVLEQKEREEKKKQKEAKRQAKEQKLMSKLVGSSV